MVFKLGTRIIYMYFPQIRVLMEVNTTYLSKLAAVLFVSAVSISIARPKLCNGLHLLTTRSLAKSGENVLLLIFHSQHRHCHTVSMSILLVTKLFYVVDVDFLFLGFIYGLFLANFRELLNLIEFLNLNAFNQVFINFLSYNYIKAGIQKKYLNKVKQKFSKECYQFKRSILKPVLKFVGALI